MRCFSLSCATGSFRRLAGRSHLFLCAAKVDSITKGILGSESGKRTLDRARRFASVFGQLASLNIASGLRAQQLWSTFLMEMDLNTEEMVSLAQKTLAGERSHLMRDSSLKESLNLRAAAGGGLGGAAGAGGDDGGADGGGDDFEGGDTPVASFDDFVQAGPSAEPTMEEEPAPAAVPAADAEPEAEAATGGADEDAEGGEDVRDDISL